jgi:hypothetical protein
MYHERFYVVEAHVGIQALAHVRERADGIFELDRFFWRWASNNDQALLGVNKYGARVGSGQSINDISSSIWDGGAHRTCSSDAKPTSKVRSFNLSEVTDGLYSKKKVKK